MLEGFPVVVQHPVAWGDMDAFGHVNNVMYFRYFELARIELLQNIGWMKLKDTIGIGPIVAATSAKYRKAVSYPDRIQIGAKIGKIEVDRVTIEHAIFSEHLNAITTTGEVVVVNYDYKAHSKVEFGDEFIVKLMKLMSN